MQKPLRIFSLGMLVFVLAIVGAGYYLTQSFLNSPASRTGAEVIYEVPPGVGFGTIAKELQKRGIIKSSTLFNIYAKLTGERSKIRVGEYLLNTSMRPSEVLSIITSGKSIARPFTVIEGLNIFEIAELYEKQKLGKREEFYKLATDTQFAETLVGEKVPTLEGYLFPETYQVTKYTDTKELITAMVRRFQIEFAKVKSQLGADSNAVKLTPRQVVILGSIVEKETGSPNERNLISSVFHNRLKVGMKLQTDPTVLYGKVMQTGQLDMNITKKDLQTFNPYNTYMIPGLPPGPISNPGRDALLAAVQPAKTKYIYFVSRNDGTTVFSETLSEHEKAVTKFQKDPKGRAGKSWRQLNQTNNGTSK